VRTFVQTWLLLDYHLLNGLIMFKLLKIKAMRLMFYESFCVKIGKLFVSNVHTFYFDVKSALVDQEDSPLLRKMKN
jgi:hypothetical protein